MEQAKALIIQSCALLILLLIPGCSRRTAAIPSGCYYLQGDKPLMIIDGRRLTLLIRGEVQSSEIGSWIDKPTGRFQISPGFYLHDGTVSPPRGPAIMSQTTTARRSGSLLYQHVDGDDVVLIPLEAYGFQKVMRGKPCAAISR